MFPTHIIAGDTHKFEYANSLYPPSAGWVVTYLLSGPAKLAVVAVAGDAVYTLTMTANQSNTLRAGLYAYALRATLGAEGYTVESGQVTVVANPLTVVSKPFIAERMVELIESALLGQLSDGEALESISISGRSLSHVSRVELLAERALWRQELANYRNAASGQSSIRQIFLNVGRL